MINMIITLPFHITLIVASLKTCVLSLVGMVLIIYIFPAG